MSPTTTLITFRVRAPASTRTLKLYGSWDNFTIGYPMSKDLQSGSDYWSGCFNFTNIICDGRPSDAMKSRSGGLKMGGTYWYHYKLDDTTDFHNVCERATNNCPLLPGQLINVLNVPVALSGNRSRNLSTSSTSSDRRTMNPEDKFMNPRPAPAKPDLRNASSSPATTDFEDSVDELGNAMPNHEAFNGSKFLGLPRKSSMDALTTSGHGPLAGGLRAAFRIRTARSQSPDTRKDGGSIGHERHASAERSTNVRTEGRPQERSMRPQKGLLLRASSDEALHTLSFEQHRRQRSQSREKRMGSSTTVEETPRVEVLNLVQSNHKPLSMLKGVSIPEPTLTQYSPQPTKGAVAELNLEKRLPTLPNTPSSAYPASLGSARGHFDFALNQLESHFSATTIDTEFYPLSTLLNEESHFSVWTTTTGTSSVMMDSSVPLPENASSTSEAATCKTGSPTALAFLPISLSYSSISSSVSNTPSTSFFDTDLVFETAQDSSKPVFIGASPHFQQYRLPEDDYSSQTTLKAPSHDSSRDRSRDPAPYNLEQAEPTRPQEAEIIHSESMQRLLDELSYLGDMIQH